MFVPLDPALTEPTAAELRRLAALARQVEASFRSCASQARAEDVRALLRRRAEASRAQAAQLQAHAQRLQPNRVPTNGGAAAWLGAVAHAVLATHTDLALLEACERTEDAALERYSEALSQPLEPAARQAIAAQRLEIRAQHELLRTMRDRLRGLES